MNDRLRLLFDENIGRPLVTALDRLLRFHSPAPLVRHIIDFEQAEGVKDDAWVPRLVEGGWIVISADRGKQGGPKLPRICRERGVTHMLVSGALHSRPQFEKARAILVVWPRLVEAAAARRGTGYRLQYHQTTPVLKRKT